MTKPDRGAESPHGAGVRLDTWLWAARFFKTRSLAKQAIEAGRVALAGRACKPAHVLHSGAMLRIMRGEECFEIEVVGLSERRGPVAVAQTLYRESEESRLARETAREQRRAKRARLLIRALGDIEAL